MESRSDDRRLAITVIGYASDRAEGLGGSNGYRSCTSGDEKQMARPVESTGDGDISTTRRALVAGATPG